MSYDMIDRFLRNNLDDDNYAEYSAALDELCTTATQQCNYCNGSGRMVRDPDIGTDHECFVCDGAGAIKTEQPAQRHPDDQAVDRFATAMKDKLAEARGKGRSGWEACPPDDLSRMLREHVEKGDPRDVANFCMMLWHHGAGIAAQPQQERCHLCDCTGDIHSPDGEWRGECPYCKQPAQPAQQEPVAYRVKWPAIGGGYKWLMVDKPLMEKEGFANEALYTSPQAQRTWVGLTDEEVKECFESVPTQDCQNYEHWRSLCARNIEAKLKEKNT